ncbi:class 1 fructose-bisphosphatase [Lunatibacter salilacus]|uniref:class 1 fructose-bisphosphatase n=1 Tax=Lunatibacter salilacus TaxID=2483804 RepID=UPI00131A6E2F|nr:class 1 fructose-bisphosphatase [Lunatibacter salilacus]
MKTKPYKQDTSPLGYAVGVTLDRFIKSNQADFPFATGELSQLLRDIALASKIVSREISRAGLGQVTGAFGQTNVQGEEQQKLDVVANIRFTRALTKGGEVCAVVSEEDDEVIDLQNKTGKYVVAIDPLDGSSNIDVNVSIGTIFSIYRRVTPMGSPIQPEDVLQKGCQQVAAGYVLYGSSTMLVFTTGNGVNGFTYEQSLGEFFLSHHDIQAPLTGQIFTINDGLTPGADPGIAGFLNACKQNGRTARYIGSLVADFHRNLLKGGIYLYPATVANPNGKIRLAYEANALAFIAEQAGGKATDGMQRILDIPPLSLHQRTPIFIGSVELVDELETYVNG